MNKLKIGIAGAAAVAILVFIGTHFQASMREKDAALVEQTDRIAQLEAENERLSNLIVKAKSSSEHLGTAPAQALNQRSSQ